MRPALRFSLLAFLLACCFAPHAEAQGRDPAAAEVLFRDAKESVKQGNYANACTLFYESQRLDPGIGTLLNIANCEEKQGHIATSLAVYQEAREQMDRSDNRIEFADKQIAELAARAPKVTLTMQGPLPEELELKRDNVKLSRSILNRSVPIDPGKHIYRVHAPGHRDTTYEITVAEREIKTVSLELGAPVTADKGTPEVAPRSSGAKTVGLTLTLVGGAALLAGGAAGAVAIVDHGTFKKECPTLDQCSQEGRDAQSRGSIAATISPIALGVGAVSLGIGLYFLLSSKSSTAAFRPSVHAIGFAF